LPGGKFGEARLRLLSAARRCAGGSIRIRRFSPAFSVFLTPQIASIFQIKPLHSSRPLLYSGVLLE
jgi:hypothetical protein